MTSLWSENNLVKGESLEVSASDRGLTLGDGLFETIAVTNGTALWRHEHLKRFQKASRVLGIPFPEGEIENAIDALTHRLKGHHVLRLTLTRGSGGRGLAADLDTPKFFATLAPFDPNLRFQPARLVTSSIRRNLHSPASSLKTLSYIDNILAAREAQVKKVEDALMLNSAGRVACSTIGNLFMVKDECLFTPEDGEAILPGVMRAIVLATAKELGIYAKQKRLWPADLEQADAIFITNSLRFIRPVTKLDGRRYTKKSKIIARLSESLLRLEQDQLMLDKGVAP